MESSYRSAASFQNSGKVSASSGLLREDEFKDPSSLEPRWWDVRAWSKKKLAIASAGLIVLMIVVVIVPVQVSKNRPYPNYSKLRYSLKDTYSGTDFFDNFDYFDAPDPSGGFVQYADSEVAAQYNLTYASSSRSVVRVDASATANSNRSTSDGRLSVRISSKKQYEDGLFIFDVVHTPIGCGTWPALWMSDAINWPTNGEIDILEAVNVVSSARNQMALHTTSGCTMNSVKRKQTGKTIHSTCSNSTNQNAGCSVHGAWGSFGAEFNSAGGGVMVMELRTAGIRIWQFRRNAIPSDISSMAPDPSTWPEPSADYPNTRCSVERHFRNQSIIVNINLCGIWAGKQSIYQAGCPGTCHDYVANNAMAFQDAYWEFNNFTVYRASSS